MYLVHALMQRDYEHQTFVQHPEMLILTVLAGIQSKYQKGYSYPSQERILTILARYGRRMSRRSLNRHLNQLVRLGWVRRRRRHTHDSTRGWCFRSTLYQLTRRSLRWLAGMSNAANRAVSFLNCTRVPNPAQDSQLQRIIAEAPPKNGGVPPASMGECSAGSAGAIESNNKNVGISYLNQIRNILHG